MKEDGDNVTIYSAHSIANNPGIGLTEGGMVLIALLVGGDYSMVSTFLCDQCSSTDSTK